MKAVVCSELGHYTGLELHDIDPPEIRPGQVRIGVRAASLNFPDLLIVAGNYQMHAEPPFVPGAEAAGVVTEVGSEVVDLAVGDRVMAVGQLGAFAQEWVVDASSVFVIPDDVEFATAASLTLAFGTSYHALVQRGNLQAEETLLVLGAAGGVGSAAVEIGKALGATVIAAASSDAKAAFCSQLGADAVINYAEEDLRARISELTGGSGVDVVFDPVGGDFAEQALRSTKPDGRFLIIGFASGDIPKIPLNIPLLKEVSLVGVFWGAFSGRDPATNRKNLDALFAMLRSGELTPRVTDRYDLADFRSAFASLAERQAMGKVVLTVGD